MPSIKDLLKAPLAFPKSIEASLPKGLPQVSTLLASFTDNLPEMPALPNALPTGVNQLPQMPMVTEFIKSIEAGLPEGLPKLGQTIIPGAREEVAPAPKKAPELIFE